jgi:hypothetical protein
MITGAEMGPGEKRWRARLFGWWYVFIGAGFVLLGASRLVQGGPAWAVALRWAIAAGFFLLGYLELRPGRRGENK